MINPRRRYNNYKYIFTQHRNTTDFNTPPTPMDRSTKQKISKETQTLNDTMDQLDLIDIGYFTPKQ